MYKITSIIIAFLLVALDVYADNNVIISDKNITCTLRADKGKLKNVKVVETTTYTATRADDSFPAVTFYGDGITIDKASAPGTQPIYRSWESDDMFFTGSRICVLPLQLKKGKPVKATFERTYTDPVQFTDVIMTSPVDVSGTASYSIVVPSDLAATMAITPHNLPDGVEMTVATSNNGDKTYNVSFTPQPCFKPEPLCGSATLCAPRLEISGFFTSTDDLYQYLRGYLSEEDPSADVNQLTQKLCENANSDIERIDTIADWVRNNIRYVGIEHGDYAFRPETADAVLRNRFADCKGSANLIKAMLRSAGIDGRLVWIGTRYDVTGSWTERPSFSAGNHLIAAAVLPDTIIFIDGTVSMAPKGMVPAGIAGQECMMEDGDSPRILHIPSADPDLNRLHLAGDVSVSSDGLTGTYRAEFYGQMRMMVEASLSSLNAAKRKSALELLSTFNRKGLHTGEVSLTTAARNAPVSTLNFIETDPTGLRTLSSGKTYIMPRPLRAVSYPRVKPEDRKYPIEISNPASYSTKLNIQIPEGYKIESVPEPIDLTSDWFEGFVTYHPADDGRSIVCDAYLKCVKTHGEPADAASWNSALKEIESASNKPIVVSPI